MVSSFSAISEPTFAIKHSFRSSFDIYKIVVLDFQVVVKFFMHLQTFDKTTTGISQPSDILFA